MSKSNLLREQEVVTNDTLLADDQKNHYRFWGDITSPYSCKLRTYMNYKGIPYKRMRVNMNAYMNVIPEKVGMTIIPVLLTPNDEVMQDTTPIMESMEAEYPEKSCIPTDARLAFFMWLLEEFADEYAVRFSMHYRWGNELNRDALSHRLARTMCYGVPDIHPSQASSMILDRQSGFDTALGLTSNEIRDSLDQQLLDLLAILDKHFESYQFLLGNKPSLADFALYGHLFAHLFNDPYSARIMEHHGARTCNWMDTITEFGDTRGAIGQIELGDWINLDAGIPETLTALLGFVAKTYIPYITATALAAQQKQKSFEVDIYGIENTFLTFQYRAWSFEQLQQRLTSLDKQSRKAIEVILLDANIQPTMMENGIIHSNLYDGFTPPFIKDGVADAKAKYLKEKQAKKERESGKENQTILTSIT